MILRAATLADARQLHAWRNAEDVRAQSRATDPIPFDRHRLWLARTLAGDRVRLYVATLGGPLDAGIGTGRLDRIGDATVEVSLVIAPEWRGRGWGRLLIERLCDEARHLGMCAAVAETRVTNAASLISFLRVGFVPEAIERNAAGTWCRVRRGLA